MDNKQKRGSVMIDFDDVKFSQVSTILMNFFNKYKLYSGESLCQNDDGNLYSSEAMGDIADILFDDIEFDYE